MAINKVEFDGTTLIDLSNDTLSNSNQIVAGIVGHLRDGTQVTGTYQGGSVQYASGTYTTATKYSSTGNRAITTITNIGFTPKYFVFYADKLSDVSATQYAIVNESCSLFGSDNRAYKTVVRTSNTSGGINGYCANTSWTTQTNGYLYLSGGTIYIRTTSSYIIEKDVTYHWEAYA